MEVYFDNSATTKPITEVIDIMMNALTNYYGNPSSLHHKGVEVEKMIKIARREVAKGLEADEREIIFTSGGTESNNLAIHGAVESNKRRGKGIITTKIEHPSVLNALKNLEAEGYHVAYLDVDSFGKIDINQFKELVSDETIFISIMHVNNEVGTIQPVEEIGKCIRHLKVKPIFHMDAVQSFGKLRFTPANIGADMVSISSHKIHGPKGIASLYIKKGLNIIPLMYGGNQETGIRSGTENVPGILGFGKAVQFLSEHMEKNLKQMSIIKDQFIKAVKSEIQDIKINGFEGEGSAPHIVNISFLGIKGEVLLHALEQDGIYVSTGSACSSRKNTKSHVLKAMGMEDEEIEGAIRFSFSPYNKIEEVDYVVEKLKKHIKVLRKIMKR
jgi:cysteine desulfurase